MRKSGFTIAEFIICIMIMFVVMGSVITIPLKKAKTTKHIQFKNGEFVCDCNNTTNSWTLDGESFTHCDFPIDNPSGQSEFFTIQLVGGGAAGSDEIGGDAGESKIVHYPSMNGNYRIVLGVGGEFGSFYINGGNTVLYKQNDSGNWELVEFASGGVGSQETIQDHELSEGVTRDDMKNGLRPDFGIAGALACGAGGNAQQPGIMGGAIIRW